MTTARARILFVLWVLVLFAGLVGWASIVLLLASEV